MNAVIDHGRIQVTLRDYLAFSQDPIERIIASEAEGYGLVAPMDSQIWWGINPPISEKTAWSMLTPAQRVELIRQFALNLKGGNYTHKIIPWFEAKEGVSRRLLGHRLYELVNSDLHVESRLRSVLNTVPGSLLMLGVRNPLNIFRDTISNPRHLKMLKAKVSSLGFCSRAQWNREPGIFIGGLSLF